jgi:membrane-bound serine protease (ClpP class)
MKHISRYWIISMLVGLLMLAAQTRLAFAQGTGGNPSAVLLTIDGPITPIQAEYLERGLREAAIQNARLIIIQIDTPGGAIDVMERMVQDIRSSKIPVITYVSPSNAMAGSAGTLITLSGDLAAMAPDTTIGAASPVGQQGQDIGTTEEAKVKEILKASVRNLTKNRSPEAIALAESTIESAKAVTVDEALKIGLVDIKARDVPDLLKQLDGRKAILDSGEVTLDTRGVQAVDLKKTLIETLLDMLVNPNLIFLLLAVGVQAILIELSSPGGWVAGFVGAVCLLLAVYGIGLIPVNWFGALFLILAFVLFVLDIKAPTHGALTIVGAASFITGSLVLFNSAQVPGFQLVSVPLVIGSGILIAASFFAIVSIALRAQRKPVMTGQNKLIGQTGYVESDLNPKGMVRVGGELWGALAEEDRLPVPKGEKIEVVKVTGLQLIVRKFVK